MLPMGERQVSIGSNVCLGNYLTDGGSVSEESLAECDLTSKISVGLKPKIPKEPQFLYFGTENFEQFRFQSI